MTTNISEAIRTPIEYVTECGRKRIIDADLMVAEFDRVMRERGQSVTIDDLSYAYYALWAWSGRQMHRERPTVIVAECGFGKSTLLEIFVRYMARKYPSTFGCVVIKDKREAVREFVEAVNLRQTISQVLRQTHESAIGIYGYDRDRETYEDYRGQFKRQVYYPVVVMTTEMWARQSNAGNTDSFLTFLVGGKERRLRSLLLIDERPNLVSTYTFAASDVSRLIDNVRTVSHEIYNGRDAGYYKTIVQAAGKLRELLEQPREDDRTKQYIGAIDPNFMLPENLRNDWVAVYNGQEYDSLRLFETAVRQGGLFSVTGGRAHLTVSYKVFYEWGAFDTYVLDATADTDPHYLSHDFTMFKPNKAHEYSNLTFHVNHSYTLSKSFFEESPQSFQLVADMIRDIAAGKQRTMVVTYQENKPKLEELLRIEVSSGKVVMKHFDSGRGVNDFRDCDCAVFIGWLLKGENYYPQLASAIHGDSLDFTHKTDRSRGFHYENETVDNVRFYDMVTERIQDIHRVRPRATTEPIDVYIFHIDREIVREITAAFGGARTVEFNPIKKLSGSETSADKLIAFFEGMKPGDRVKAVKIREATGVIRKTFGRIEKDARVIEAMRKYGVTKDKTVYVKQTEGGITECAEVLGN